MTLIMEKEITGSPLYKEIYKCLDNLSNSVGETITEYHWREFCGLMKCMEDESLSSVDVVAPRFLEFIKKYDDKIDAEESFLLRNTCPIEVCDDMLYEMRLKRQALIDCYGYVFNVK